MYMAPYYDAYVFFPKRMKMETGLFTYVPIGRYSACEYLYYTYGHVQAIPIYSMHCIW